MIIHKEIAIARKLSGQSGACRRIVAPFRKGDAVLLDEERSTPAPSMTPRDTPAAMLKGMSDSDAVCAVIRPGRRVAKAVTSRKNLFITNGLFCKKGKSLLMQFMQSKPFSVQCPRNRSKKSDSGPVGKTKILRFTLQYS